MKESCMGKLTGLDEYLGKMYQVSVFDQAFESGEIMAWHLHNQRVLEGRVKENLVYDVKLETGDGKEETVVKHDITFFHRADLMDQVNSLIKVDEKVRQLGLEPILSPGKRYHVKNKTLFPLMREKEVLFFILLEGEILRGVVKDFNRYEIMINMKRGVPLTLLRHAVYDLRNKRGRCFLKSFQEKHRDWEKSPLYVP
jgi:sRNA-binding regulator protein Hfq